MSHLPWILGAALILLTSQANAADHTPETCLTMHKLKDRRQQGPLATSSTRPPAADSMDSTVIPLRIHWQEGVERGYVEKILEAAEISWKVLFDEIGFVLPHPDGVLGGDDRFDIYIVTDLIEGVGGYTSFSGYYEATERNDAYGYIVLADDVDDRLLRGVVAHELSHASQIARDFWEHLSFMEGTAVWATNRVFPDENMAWRYFTFFQDEPFTALNYTSITAPYQYGTGMWVTYLEERFGDGTGSFLKSVWQSLEQPEFDNEPDYFDALETLLADRGTTMAKSYAEFGGWRTFVGSRDDGAHFLKASSWTGWRKSIEPHFAIIANPSTTYIEGETAKGLQQFSHGLISLKRPPQERATYNFQFQFTTAASYQLDLYTRSGGDAWRQSLSRVLSAEDSEVSLALSPDEPVDEIVGVLTAFGAVGFDPDTAVWQDHHVRYQIEVVAK